MKYLEMYLIVSMLFLFSLMSFSQNNRTSGDSSPIVNSIYGDIHIEYKQIPRSALIIIIQIAIEKSGHEELITTISNLSVVIDRDSKTIHDQQEIIVLQKAQLGDYRTKINNLVKSYESLNKELKQRESSDSITIRAQSLLQQGKF